jgi:hypothetical protein
MSRPLHPALSDLYSGADAVNRVMAFLREPKERMERLTESPHMLPLFRQESVIAGLFSELGLDAVLSQRLTGTEEAGEVAPIVRATRSKSPERPLSNASSHGAALPQQRVAGTGPTQADRFVEKKIKRADTGEKRQLVHPAVEERLFAHKEAADAHAADLHRTGGTPAEPLVDKQSVTRLRNRKMETLSQAIGKEPSFLENDKKIPERHLAGSKLGKIEAASGKIAKLWKQDPAASQDDPVAKSLHTPVVIRENASDDSNSLVSSTSHSAKAASPVQPTLWQARLERLVGKLEAARQSRPESGSQPETESQNGNGMEFGHRGGLRGLASLGQPLPGKRTQPERAGFELPDSGSYPRPSDSGPADNFADELAAVLRREAERCGVSPEEWNQ